MSSSMLNFFYYCCFLLYCCCCEYLTTCTVFMTHNVLLYVGTYSTYLLSEGVQAPPPLSILKPRWQNLFHSLPVCLTQVLHMITAEKNPDRSLSCSRGLFKFVNLVVNIVYRERRKCDARELRKLECLAKPHSPTVWGNKNEAIDKTTISFLSVSENAQIFSCLCVIISLSGLALSLGTQAVESLPKPHSLSAQSQCYATANYFHSAPTKPGEGEREDIIKEREGRGADSRTSESQVRKEIVRLIKVKVKKLRKEKGGGGRENRREPDLYSCSSSCSSGVLVRRRRNNMKPQRPLCHPPKRFYRKSSHSSQIWSRERERQAWRSSDVRARRPAALLLSNNF